MPFILDASFGPSLLFGWVTFGIQCRRGAWQKIESTPIDLSSSAEKEAQSTLWRRGAEH